VLSLSFHLTFAPERRYLAALLEYAALGKSGSMREMADDTGIPMGESTGKLPAILRYAQGMGLIEVDGNSIKRPLITDFGRVVFEEDPLLGEGLTQWLVHFNMCRGDIGAIAWHSVFAQSMLGSSFSKLQLEEYLTGVFGGKDRSGPLLVTYSDDAALARAGVLKFEDVMILRAKAPLIRSYAVGYSAFLLTLMDAYFPSETQVTTTDFNDASSWFDVCFWTDAEREMALTMMEETGNISIDRQMRPWIIEKRKPAAEVWPTTWADLA